MKKVLLASTALVASAGMAAADVGLSGSAEIGIVSSSAVVLGAPANSIMFHTDIDVTFTMSGETDNGLTFGASVDLDESDGTGAGATAVGASAAFGNRTQGGETIFISGNFGTLTMGDTDGAFDKALTEVGIGGSIADDHTTHAGYNGNAGMDGRGARASGDGQIARYDYTFNSITFSASAELDPITAAAGNIYGVGVAWSGDFGGTTVGIGIGWQGDSLESIVGGSITAAMANGLQVRFNYSSISDSAAGAAFTAGDTSHIAVGIGYTMDAWTFAGNWGQFSNPGGNRSGFGAVINYSLGGGATLQAGYGSTTGGASTWSFGLAMSF